MTQSRSSPVSETLIAALQAASIEYPNPHDEVVVISVAMRDRLVAVLSAGLAQRTAELGNRFCKHDDCPYPDCLVGGICPSQPPADSSQAWNRRFEFAKTPALPFVSWQYMGGNKEEYAVIRANDWRQFVATLSSSSPERGSK
jgi:hypothetical protein